MENYIREIWRVCDGISINVAYKFINNWQFMQLIFSRIIRGLLMAENKDIYNNIHLINDGLKQRQQRRIETTCETRI